MSDIFNATLSPSTLLYFKVAHFSLVGMKLSKGKSLKTARVLIIAPGKIRIENCNKLITIANN